MQVNFLWFNRVRINCDVVNEKLKLVYDP